MQNTGLITYQDYEGLYGKIWKPNNWGVRYEGERGGRTNSWLPVAKLQRDLYRAVKSDPVLKEYPVWTLSESGAEADNVGLQFLKIPDGTETLMPAGTVFADYANCHSYMTHPGWPGLHDNQTWIAADPDLSLPGRWVVWELRQNLAKALHRLFRS